MNPANLLFFAAGALANLILIPLLIRLAHAKGLLDRPGHRKIHEKPVPLVGGLAFMLSLLASVVGGLLLFGKNLALDPLREERILLVLTVTVLAGILGFLDDRYDLKPRVKLLAQVLLFGAFVLCGFHFYVMHLPGTVPFQLSFLGYPLTLFWILGVVNGFNFIDGADGLAGTVGVVSLLGLGAVALITGGPSHTGVLWVSALGALLVFLFFNWRPAKIYLGDSGSNALGALVACSLVAMGQGKPALVAMLDGVADPPLDQEPVRFHFLAATLLAGYALSEVTLSTLRRFAKRLAYARSMEWAEQDHLHHRLMKQGLQADTIAILAGTFQSILVAAALLAMVRQNAIATWLLLPLSMLLAYLGPRTGILDVFRMRGIKARPHYQIANHFIAMQRVKLGLTHDREEVLALVGQACRELGVRCFRLRIAPDVRGKGGLEYFFQNDDSVHSKAEEFLTAQAGSLSGEVFDFYEVPGGRGEAFWIFDSHLHADELDMEYRVLMSGFMKESVETCMKLGEGQPNLNHAMIHRLPHHKTSGHHLRKRHGHQAKLN
ncbi:MAG TPA: MraY family glycosyltransferase [bacterium]|nr:MraY family glycosyltransferase [bacterium]